MLHQALRKPIAPAVAWVQAEARRLPFRAACFDWVVCASSFHYFRQPRYALAEFARVLRPSGSLVLVDWCDDFLMCKLCSFWLRWTDPAFYRTYTLGQCRRLLEEAGLCVRCQDRFRVNWLWGLMRLVCSRPGMGP